MISSRDKTLPPLPGEKSLDVFFCSGIRESSRKGFVLMAKEPAVARVRTAYSAYTIKIPWHLFGATLHFNVGIGLLKTGLWFLDKRPSSSHKNLIYNCSLPNVSGDGTVCFGKAAPYCMLPVGKYMDSLYSRFWQTRFNQEIYPHYNPWSQAGMMSFSIDSMFKRWEDDTKAGRDILFKPNPYARTIEDAMSKLDHYCY
jgi:hypothetical protein